MIGKVGMSEEHITKLREDSDASGNERGAAESKCAAGESGADRGGSE